jgi:hypothetical protein
MNDTAVWRFFPVTSFRDVATEWDSLNRVNSGLPLLDSYTVELLCREFGSGKERVAFCSGPEGPLAAAILHRRGVGLWETFQPAQSPLGAWVSNPTTPIRDLLRSLSRSLPLPCFQIALTQQDPEILARPMASECVSTLDYIETSRISILSSFDEYWQSRGSNLRQNLKKQRNRLAKDGVDVRLEVISSADAIGKAVDEFGLLESSGWKGAEGTAVHPGNAQGRYYRCLFERLAAQGEATVLRYLFNGRLAASDLCLHRDGVLIVLKTAFDETNKSISPALLMKTEAYRELFSDGRTRRIEFYGKAMEWHRKWTDEMRTMYHINYFRWPWLAKLRGNG